ncbi:MAG: polyhydroxyalkanoic acid system family protein [Phenylobacterium sp.]|nr:polyhydroxyalkanoic acid system family protein [Phenylobacterium sp.]
MGRVEARRRIEEGVGRLTSHIGAVGELRQRWDGDTMRFSLDAIGQTVTGSIGVDERDVRLEVNLPGIFAMIAGKVKGRLREEGQLLLSGPKKG